MMTLDEERKLLNDIGGPRVLAEKGPFKRTRVVNWYKRGIPNDQETRRQVALLAKTILGSEFDQAAFFGLPPEEQATRPTGEAA